jgi:hypothetical protein
MAETQQADSLRTDEWDGPVLNDDDLESVTEAEEAAYPVGYTGTDFDVEGLVRRINRGDIVVPTFGSDNGIETAGFQRSFVWKRPQMDRFIESLLLGYPIPGIMLVEQQDRRYLVLDGQQRLTTLAAFYAGIHDRQEFALRNVSSQFYGMTYANLAPDFRRQLDNTFIQATIVKTDGSEQSLDAVYQVFERLNSGGTQLTPHEIRVALYAGPFVELLSRLNDNPNWRSMFGPASPRLRDQELILRILALYVAASTYKRPLKKFLNDFLGEHRTLDRLQVDFVSHLFDDASAALEAGPGRAALRPGGTRINVAFAEAVYVGLMRRLEQGPVDPNDVLTVTAELESDEGLSGSITSGTAEEENVRTRLAVATRAFSQI